MKIFIAGATGYIGGAVARAARARGHHVIGSARSLEAKRKLEAAGIPSVTADLTQPETMVSAARLADAVVQAASPGDATSPKVEPRAALALVEGLAGSGKPLILTSGVWVFGPTGATHATEETPLNPFRLVAWRPPVEQAVLQAKGMRGMVIRPGMVYGNGGGMLAMFEEARERGKVSIPGDGRNHWSTVHVEDLADLYVLALEKGSSGLSLNGTSDEEITLGDIGRILGQRFGLPVEFSPIEEARRAMGPFADALAMDQRVRSPRARTVLGWRPGRPTMREDLEGPGPLPAA